MTSLNLDSYTLETEMRWIPPTETEEH